jgi:hypothetical protein
MSKTNVIGKKALTPKEASVYVGLSVSTLARLRQGGIGIPYIKIGKNNSAVRYSIKALDEYLANGLKVI